jgi:hypothetical protein
MWRHPEQKDDEVYLCNASDAGYARIGWATKRVGATPYDIKMQPIDNAGDFFPVFVKRAEMQAANVRSEDWLCRPGYPSYNTPEQEHIGEIPLIENGELFDRLFGEDKAV